MFTKTFAASALAILAVVAIAPAANAYTPDAPATVSSSAVPGAAVAAAFGADTFLDGEAVSFTVNGDTTATLSEVKAVLSGPITKNATATGAATVTVTLPANATGAYAVSAVSASGITAAITIPTATAADLAATGNLAETGVNSPLLLVWAAAGVLLLGVAFLLVRNTVRRQGATA